MPHEPDASEHLSLILREMTHRCNNDLQLIVTLLSLQRSACQSEEARTALEETMTRVAMFARLRSVNLGSLQSSLGEALRKVGEALRPFTEPRAITLQMEVDLVRRELAPRRILSATLAVNELVTNALKHGFAQGQPGRIFIRAHEAGDGEIHIIVEDDGKPLATTPGHEGHHQGLDLVRQLMRSVGGRLTMPTQGSKVFELIVPA